MNTAFNAPKTHGFTLVEISVVLLIIALLISGILVGKDLLRAAEVRSYISNVEQIKSAITAFRIKYNCLPGDCGNATDIWGTYASCPTQSSRPDINGTCNGNGNGRYNPWPTDSFLATEHLALSNLYTSKKVSASYYSYLTFVPMADSAYIRTYLYTNDLYSSTLTNSNTFTIGAYSGSCWSGVSFTASQSQQMDSKMDDGIANKGRVNGMDGKEPNLTPNGCTDPVVACRSGTDYDLSNATSTNPRCRMVFYLDN